jgi:GTP-binding GTPase Middle Region
MSPRSSHVKSLGIHRCRGRGRSGASSGGLGGGGGAGETELQLQRRRIDARRRALRLKLGEVQRTRAVQRAGRRRSGKPLIAVVVRGSVPDGTPPLQETPSQDAEAGLQVVCMCACIPELSSATAARDRATRMRARAA